MFRAILKRAYLVVHAALYKAIPFFPFIPKYVNGRRVKSGFVSAEHLENPALDDRLVEDLQRAGIPVRPYRIDITGYAAYLRMAHYPRSYHGGSGSKKYSFLEKSLEHYVSATLLQLSADDMFMDIASRHSPFYRIVKEIWNPKTVYRQDLAFPEGIHGDTIGGTAGHLPLLDRSITKATLHCSLEHFEGDSDMELFREMSRVLAPEGLLCILPFYIAQEYTIHTDPIYDLFFGRGLRFDPEAQIRYCSWNNRHSRHYDVEHLEKRIISHLNGLRMTVLRVENFREVHPDCYLRFIALFEKMK
jgi:SAM-dependent methyltransferase